MGRAAHNQYNIGAASTEVRVIRNWHPLRGQLLPVVTAGRTQVVVRLANGTSMRVPRSWTDIDGAPSSPSAQRLFSIDSLLELLELVALLKGRS